MLLTGKSIDEGPREKSEANYSRENYYKPHDILLSGLKDVGWKINFNKMFNSSLNHPVLEKMPRIKHIKGR